MFAKLEHFDSGWIGLAFEISEYEIDYLINSLKELKAGSIGHFHFRADGLSSEKGIADVELSLLPNGAQHNMVIE